MSGIDKDFWIERLVDGYGFTFNTAKEIIEQPNADYIIRLLVTAHTKGMKDGAPIYNYSGGL